MAANNIKQEPWLISNTNNVIEKLNTLLIQETNTKKKLEKIIFKIKAKINK